MKNGTESQKPSSEELGTFADFTIESLFKIFDADEVTYYLGHKEEYRKKLEELKRKLPIMGDYPALRIGEEKFWKEHFKLNVDFGGVLIPPKPETGSWRILTEPQGMTNNKVFARMEQLFECWRYADDLDAAVLANIRTTQNHYAVWVRDGVEPDKEFLGKSVRDADPYMKIGMTLTERLTRELKYFDETGNHLDIKGGTWCSGSRDSDGGVPSVRWYPYDGTVGVDWSYVGYSGSKWGIRRAVSS